MAEGPKKTNGNPLASPEELSKSISLVDTKAKFALGAGAVLAFSLLVWSIFGSVPEMVPGSGILVPPGGLLNVVSLGQGQVTELDISPGDMVESGEIVARIAMPELDAERQSILANLKNAKLWTEERENYYEQTMDVQGRNNAERIEQFKFRMAYLTEYFNFLKKHVKGLDRLNKGYITPKEVETTRKNMQSVLSEINDCKLKIAEIQAGELDLKSKADQDDLQSRKNQTELELALENVERKLKVFSRVRTPYSGVVVETGVEKGDYVSPGMQIAALRPVDSPLEAALLFPAESGKKIKPGMVAYIYPSTAAKSEYGCIYGLVSAVSEYPASPESLMQSIGTKQLINSLLEQGVMIMAKVSLLRDPDVPSGFKWSSSKGPEDMTIDAGTVCTGNVVIKRNRPIDLVFPNFSKMLGLAEK